MTAVSQAGWVGRSSQGQVQGLPPLPGELHLTPLHGILQLRPSFSYLDKADAKHREREAANEGELWMPSPSVCILAGWVGRGRNCTGLDSRALSSVPPSPSGCGEHSQPEMPSCIPE